VARASRRATRRRIDVNTLALDGGVTTTRQFIELTDDGREAASWPSSLYTSVGSTGHVLGSTRATLC